MANIKDIIINEFSNGMAESAATGNALILGGDIDTKLGWLGAGKSFVNISGAPSKSFLWIIKANNDINYGLTEEGKLYTISTSSISQVTGNTITNAEGNGLVYWNNYLLVFRRSTVDAYGPLNGTPAWTNLSSISIGANNRFWCPIVSADGAVYVVNESSNGTVHYIAKLSKPSGVTFAPGTSSTYSFEANKLDIMENYRPTALCEFGSNLFIGSSYGKTGAYTPTLTTSFKKSAVFMWDYNSPSYENPLLLNEFGVVQMIAVNGLVYCITAGKPRIFVTNGTSIKFVKEIKSLKLGYTSLTQGYPGAIINNGGKIVFGVSENTSDGNDSGYGVYSLDIEKKGYPHTKDYEIQNGSGATSYTAILPTPTGYFVSAMFNSSPDEFNVAHNTGSLYGTSYFESKIFEIGGHFDKKASKSIELFFNRNLASDDEVYVYFRNTEDESWTLIKHWDGVTFQGKSSLQAPFHSFDTSIMFKITHYKTTGTPLFLKYARAK